MGHSRKPRALAVGPRDETSVFGWQRRGLARAIAALATGAAMTASPLALAAPPSYGASDAEWNPSTINNQGSPHVISLRGEFDDLLGGQAPIAIDFPSGNAVNCVPDGNNEGCADPGSLTVSAVNGVCLSLAYTFPGEQSLPTFGDYSLPPVRLSNNDGAITLNNLPLSVNSGLPNTASNCAYTAPTAGNDSFTVPSSTDGGTESGNLLSTMESNDSDSDGDAIGFNQIVSAPPNGSLRIVGGQQTGTTTGVFYTPDSGFTGVDQFTYTVFDSSSNGSVSNTATVQITVTNEAPTISVDANFDTGTLLSIDEGGSEVLTATASDREAGTLSFSYSNLPAFCSAQDTANGISTTTCAPGFNDQGSYTVGVQVSDNGVPVASDQTSFDLNIVDQALPTLQMAAASLTVAEAAGNAIVSVTRGGTSSGAVSVDYSVSAGTATAGEDYTVVSGTLNWSANDTAAQTIAVPIVDDNRFEPNAPQTFDVVLSNPGGSAVLGTPGSTTVAITDNDTQPTVSLSSTAVSAAESDTSVTLTVTRGGDIPESGSATVDFVTADGTAIAGADYEAGSGTLSWSGDDVSARTLTITLTDDDLFEGSTEETFSVELQQPSTGLTISPNSSATISLSDDEAEPVISFNPSSYNVGEASGVAVMTVSRSGAAGGAITVEYASANGTAEAGQDYIETLGTLTWDAGDATDRTIEVPILNDDLFEDSGSDETFTVELSNLSGVGSIAAATGTVAIADDEAVPTLRPGATSATVGEAAGTVTVEIQRSGAAGGSVSVDYATADDSAIAGEDYQAASGTLNWADGDLDPQQIVVNVINDADFEGSADELFNITLSNPTAGVELTSEQIEIAITDDETPPLVAFAVTEQTVLENVGTVELVVSRTGASNAASSIDYQTVAGSAVAGTDFTATSGTLTWDAGDTSDQTIELVVVDDTEFENPVEETLTVELLNPLGSELGPDSVQTITIDDNDFAASDSVGIAGPDVLVRVNDATGLGDFRLDAVQSAQYVSYEWTQDGNVITDQPGVNQSLPPGEYFYTLSVVDINGQTLTDSLQAEVTRELVQDADRLQDIDGLSETERSVAVAVDSICGRLNTRSELTADQDDLRERCSQIILNDNLGEKIEALGAISGRQITSQMTTVLEIGGLQYRNIAERQRRLRRGDRQDSTAGLNINVQGKQIPKEAVSGIIDLLTGGNAGDDGSFGRWAFFVSGNLSFGEQDDTDRETGFDFDTGGITAGFDYRFNDRLFGGFALGYGQGDADFNRNIGTLETDVWSGSVFGSYVSDRYYVDGLVGFSISDLDTERNISYTDALGSVQRTAQGNTDGNQLTVGLETGLNLTRGPWLFNPNISVFYADASIDNFSESGAAGLNLRYDDQDNESMTVSGGLSLSYTFSTERMVIIPQLRLDYVRELENDGQVINVRFLNDPFANDAGNPSPAIAIRTDDPDDSYVTLGLGVSAQFVNGISGYVDWQTVSAYDDLSVDSLSFGLRWERLF
ncbi:MAG: Calx-beta domain-containing protein [Pseudomonadales bacterium]